MFLVPRRPLAPRNSAGPRTHRGRPREWRDYAIGGGRDAAMFAIFRRTSEAPVYRIEKRPELARKQGAFAVIGTGEVVLRRGHDLAQVLKVFDSRKFKVIE